MAFCTGLTAQVAKEKLAKSFGDEAKKLDDSLTIRKQAFLQEAVINQQVDSHIEDRGSLIREALAIQFTQKDSIVLAQAFHDIGRIYRRNGWDEKAMEVYPEALKIRRKVLPNDHPHLSHTLDNMGDIFIDLNKLDSAYISISEGMLIRERLVPEDPWMCGDSYTKMAKLYNSYLDYDQAIYYMQKANQAYRSVFPENHPLVIRSYVNLATILVDMGEYAKAYQYASISNEYYRHNVDRNMEAYIANKVSLGRILAKQNKLEAAIDMYEEALSLHKKHMEFTDELYSYTKTHLGIAKMLSGQSDEARKYLNSSLNIITDKHGAGHPESFWVKEMLAQNEQKAGNDVKAIQISDAVIQEKVGMYGQDHYEVFNSELLLAKLFVDSNRPDKAETLLLRLMKSIEKSEWMIEDPIYISANIELVKLYKRKGLHSNDEFESILTQTNSLIQKEQSLILSVEDQLIRNQEFELFYDLVVEYFTDKTLQTNNLDDANELFKFIEQAKGNSIFQSLRHAFAWESNTLPVDILEQKRTLKYEISQTRLALKNISTSVERDNLSKLKLVRLQDEYLELMRMIELNYPEFYEKKYATKRVSFEEFRNNLSENQLAIEYYVSDQYLIGLSFDKHSFKIIKHSIDKTTLDCIQNLIELQQEQTTDILIKNQHISQYLQYSDCIRNILLDGHLDSHHQTERLIIIPHKMLNNISFETICFDKSNKKIYESYKSLPYLIKDYAISYLYAASLPKLKNVGNLKPYVGFAPTFSATNTATKQLFYDLPLARQNIKLIADKTGGKSYLGTQSTITNFQEEVSEYNVIHISTHAEIDQHYNLQSKLWLSGENDQTLSPITVEDIYQQEIPASLVVLSACQTGVGEAISGEGPIHFSHAFSHAGVKNTWMSLWSIPENSTSAIISDGLERFTKGISMDIAMQQSKIKYLNESAERTAAPFYWGGMISVGAQYHSHKESSTRYLYFIIFIILFLLLTIIFSKNPLKKFHYETP